MKPLQDIDTIISSSTPADAIAAITAHLAVCPDDDDALYKRGKLFWKMGDRRNALNDYNAAVAVNPSSPAALALETANAILDFYNRDLYNP